MSAKRKMSFKGPVRDVWVECVAARDLAAMDSNGLSDPYVVIKLFAAPGDKKECDKATTAVRKKTLNPMWGVGVKLGCPLDAAAPTLHFELFDEDLVTSDKLGAATVSPLADNDGLIDAWLPLSGGPKVKGEVHVRYKLAPLAPPPPKRMISYSRDMPAVPVVREGWLEKKGSTGHLSSQVRMYDRRYFVLTKTELMYWREELPAKQRVVPRPVGDWPLHFISGAKHTNAGHARGGDDVDEREFEIRLPQEVGGRDRVGSVVRIRLLLPRDLDESERRAAGSRLAPRTRIEKQHKPKQSTAASTVRGAYYDSTAWCCAPRTGRPREPGRRPCAACPARPSRRTRRGRCWRRRLAA